ncbi:hypothetical protein IFM89_027475, partial [Coptis chinensis]
MHAKKSGMAGGREASGGEKREVEMGIMGLGSVCGDLNKAAAVEGSSVFPPRHVEPEPYIPVVNNLVGVSYLAKEASILDKLMK